MDQQNSIQCQVMIVTYSIQFAYNNNLIFYRQARQASERIDNVPVYQNVMLSQSSSNDTLKTDDEKGPDIELCAIKDPDKTYSGHNGGIPAIGVPVILNAELLRDNAAKLTVTAEDSEENCLMDEPHDESDEKTTYF